MPRLIRSAAALVVLLLTVVGVPVLLVALGRGLLPRPVPGRSLLEVLLQPDDGSVLLALIAGVAWLAWAVFAASVLAELVTLLSRRRVRVRLPGLGGPQRAAAGLILAAFALSAAPAVPHAGPAPPAARADTRPAQPPAPTPPLPTVSEPAAAADRSGDDRGSPTVVHLVRPGDDLWSLAERYYGDGPQWRRIAAANPTVLTGGPDRLTVGWRLTVPDAVHVPAAEEAAGVTVRPGDTLSAIAARELGTADRWPELHRANRAQLADPDELDAGMRLVVPVTDRVADRAPVAPSDTPVESPPGATAAPSRCPGPPADGPLRSSSRPPPAGAAVERAASPPEAVPRPVEQREPAAEDGLALPLAGVGGLLAAGLLAGLATRRRQQLQQRPLGRRIVHPPPATRPVEVALARRQRPLTLRTLDEALRAIGSWCRAHGQPLPPLQLALAGEDEIELVLARPCATAPVGFVVRDRSWLLDRAAAAYLRTTPGVAEALRPWPALVTLGRDPQGRQVLADLEALGLLRLHGGGDGVAEGVLAAMAVELSFSPWAEEMALTVVGPDDRLPAALGRHVVRRTSDPDALLQRLERRAADQRRQQPHEVLGQHRLDPDLAEAWAPEIVLVTGRLTPEQDERLQAVVRATPRVTAAAVVVAEEDGGWALRLGAQAGQPAVLSPLALELQPQVLEPEETRSVLELVQATGRSDTTPAPWWHHETSEPDPPPDNVTYLGRRFGGWAAEASEGDEMRATAAAVGGPDGVVEHPTLLLLGPVELLGATGTLPPRAGKQCLEYCAWLLENPGRSARGMASALAVAEGTRRSNMSRLRSWLGDSAEGEAYLPDAYTGRIVLHPAVSSDWQRLQILTATGVNRASTEALRAALHLVRGAPLADAAPGQWHWAEELRTDMISCVRDVGVELARRALEDRDLEPARWAAARALAAAPGDELLVATRIRTEHLAGNPAETERLTLQLAAQARRLGVDLDPQTVVLLQEVMEGRVRARLA